MARLSFNPADITKAMPDLLIYLVLDEIFVIQQIKLQKLLAIWETKNRNTIIL